VGRDKLIAARAGRSVPAQTMAAAIDGTPALRLFAAAPTEVAADTAAELATGTDRMLQQVDNVGKSFGGNSAVTDVSLTPLRVSSPGSRQVDLHRCVVPYGPPLAGLFLGRGIREYWRRSGKAEFATLVAVGRSPFGVGRSSFGNLNNQRRRERRDDAHCQRQERSRGHDVKIIPATLEGTR